jgi:hypothetical protein
MAGAECVMWRHRVRRRAKNESLGTTRMRFVEFGGLTNRNIDLLSLRRSNNDILSAKTGKKEGLKSISLLQKPRMEILD